MTVSPLKTKLTFPGLRQLLLPRRPKNSRSADTEFIQPQGSGIARSRRFRRSWNECKIR